MVWNSNFCYVVCGFFILSRVLYLAAMGPLSSSASPHWK